MHCKKLFLLASAIAFSSLHAKHEKIIIDADVGIDDAMAILLAMASPELDVVGITTVFGNATIENSTKNALYLCAISGRNIPVAQGSATPWAIPPGPPTDFVHGGNGLGNISFGDTALGKPESMSAAEFIVQQSHEHAGELTLVPVGRLTNIALALQIDPTLPERIKRIVLMGGAIKTGGNVTPVAEANIIGDPHAADIVFQAGWDVTVIGLDVTTQLIVSPADLEGLVEANPEVGQFITDISEFYLAFYRSIGLTEGFFVHDPSAILYLLRPDFYTTEQAPVRVVTEGIAIGQTIAGWPPHDTRDGAWKGVPAASLALEVDTEKAHSFLLERWGSLEFR